MKIGVLALQGAFLEHIQILRQLGVETAEIRLPEQLAEIDGLIIPGGESTTIGKLAVMYDLMAPLRDFAQSKPMWGTCAGMIFMAKSIGEDQPLLSVMDIVVERNAFGRQIDSFEIKLPIPVMDDDNNEDVQVRDDAPFPAVFIRAPKLVQTKGNAHVIATLPDGTPVAAQEDHLLVTSFHPELSDDSRFHAYFLSLVEATQHDRTLIV